MPRRPNKNASQQRRVAKRPVNRLDLVTKIMAGLWLIAGLSVTFTAYTINEPRLIFQGITTVACSVGILRNKKLAAQIMIGLIVWASFFLFAEQLDNGFDLRTLLQTVIPYLYLTVLVFWIKKHSTIEK